MSCHLLGICLPFVAWDSSMGRDPVYVYLCTFESDVVHRLDHSPDDELP